MATLWVHWKHMVPITPPILRCHKAKETDFQQTPRICGWCRTGVSVNLDSRVDPADEGVGSVESNRAGHEPEGEDHQRGVAKVEKCRNELGDLQLNKATICTNETVKYAVAAQKNPGHRQSKNRQEDKLDRGRWTDI